MPTCNEWTCSCNDWQREGPDWDSFDDLVEMDETVTAEELQETVTTAVKEAAPLKDMKAAPGVKAPLSMLPAAAMYYAARAFEYGASKYAEGNYRRPPNEGVTPEQRYQFYTDAFLRHMLEINTAIGMARGMGTSVAEAIRAPDEESGLPHLAHMAATFFMMMQQAVDAGVIPLDPGQKLYTGPKKAEAK